MNPEQRDRLEQIRKHAYAALSLAWDAHCNRREPWHRIDGVNWSNLSVVSVEHYEALDGHCGDRVVIEEADSAELAKFVHEHLAANGLPLVEVLTEW